MIADHDMVFKHNRRMQNMAPQRPSKMMRQPRVVRSLQSEGRADESLCRGAGGDALLERGDSQAEFHTQVSRIHVHSQSPIGCSCEDRQCAREHDSYR